MTGPLRSIRLAERADASAIAAIYRPIVEATAISFETVAPSETEIGRRIADTLPTHPWLVCEIDGRIRGYAYATRHRARHAYQWSVDTSIYVDAECRRAGVGRGLYQSLLAILTAQGFVNAYAGITLPNGASVGLHERVGFTPLCVYERVGYKVGAWHDVGWWRLLLQAHAASPPDPLALDALRTGPAWDSLLKAGCGTIGPRK